MYLSAAVPTGEVELSSLLAESSILSQPFQLQWWSDSPQDPLAVPQPSSDADSWSSLLLDGQLVAAETSTPFLPLDHSGSGVHPASISPSPPVISFAEDQIDLLPALSYPTKDAAYEEFWTSHLLTDGDVPLSEGCPSCTSTPSTFAGCLCSVGPAVDWSSFFESFGSPFGTLPSLSSGVSSCSDTPSDSESDDLPQQAQPTSAVDGPRACAILS